MGISLCKNINCVYCLLLPPVNGLVYAITKDPDVLVLLVVLHRTASCCTMDIKIEIVAVVYLFNKSLVLVCGEN